IISFIAPMIVYLLSMFSKGIDIIRRRDEIERSQIGDLLRANIPPGVLVDATVVADSNDALQEIERRNSRRINLLTPTRQIVRIFSPLFFSLLCIMIYKLVKDHDLGLYN